mmetsp:Transcript_3412/g.13604  ORF Transcript_3412/g.13604 Transcript_3412/m.13604 type:complete len:638 (-) Transcript_3412:722-2635(-)
MVCSLSRTFSAALLETSDASRRVTSSSVFRRSMSLVLSSLARKPCAWCSSNLYTVSVSFMRLQRSISSPILPRSRTMRPRWLSVAASAVSPSRSLSLASSTRAVASLATSVTFDRALASSARAALSSSNFSSLAAAAPPIWPSASTSFVMQSRTFSAGNAASFAACLAASSFSLALIAAAFASSAAALARSSARRNFSRASSAVAATSSAAERASSISPRIRDTSASLDSNARLSVSALCSASCTRRLAALSASAARRLASVSSARTFSTSRSFSSFAAHASSSRSAAMRSLPALSSFAIVARADSNSRVIRSSSASTSSFAAHASCMRPSASLSCSDASLVAMSAPSATLSSARRASASCDRTARISSSFSFTCSRNFSCASRAASRVRRASSDIPDERSSAPRASASSARVSPRYHSFFDTSSSSWPMRSSISFRAFFRFSSARFALSSARSALPRSSSSSLRAAWSSAVRSSRLPRVALSSPSRFSILGLNLEISPVSLAASRSDCSALNAAALASSACLRSSATSPSLDPALLRVASSAVLRPSSSDLRRLASCSFSSTQWSASSVRFSLSRRRRSASSARRLISACCSPAMFRWLSISPDLDSSSRTRFRASSSSDRASASIRCAVSAASCQ